MSAAVADSTATSVTVADAVAQENRPRPVNREKCMGHHWKMFAITFPPGLVGLGFGIASVITGAFTCSGSSSNYAAGIACAVIALALSIFACAQTCCVPWVQLDTKDKSDLKSGCNGYVQRVAVAFAVKAFLAGLAGAIVTGIIKRGC